MHIGFRYHIASLTAVFFSLGLGILIGGALLQDNRLVAEQGRIIGELESSFRVQQRQLKSSIAWIESLDSAWLQVRGVIVSDKLRGRFFQPLDVEQSDRWTPITATLHLAGAEIAPPIQIDDVLSTDIRQTQDNPVVLVWHCQLNPEIHGPQLEQISQAGWTVVLLEPLGWRSPSTASESGMRVEAADTLVGELLLVQVMADERGQANGDRCTDASIQ